MPPNADPTSPAWVIGVLIGAIVALAGTIAYLFRYYSARMAASESEISKERVAWAIERARLEGVEVALRAEYEEKHRKLLEGQVKSMQDMFEAARNHENLARREYAANMEVVAGKVSEASDKLAAVLDKMIERVMGVRRAKGD
jgi:hypothetical protein